MSDSRHSTRQRLIDAALELFAAQGITETTTRQIAESAEVNEVTLFRHFGNKHGLLLAVIEEAAVFMNLGQMLAQPIHTSSLDQALREYAIAALQALEKVPEVVRSVIGEAGQYPSENRRALGQGLTQANGYAAKYFAGAIDRGSLQAERIQGEQIPLSAEKLASLLNSLLLGYAVIEFTSEFHELWRDRDDFLEHLVRLFLPGGISSMRSIEPVQFAPVVDLPATLVHTLLQRAKKSGLQDYAMVYLMFAAGLSPGDLVRLERSHHISDVHQQLMQIPSGSPRQVPINQWIMGKRYGSYLRNPLTQWLRSRKDTQAALFLNAAGTPLRENEVWQRWRDLAAEQLTPTGHPPTPEQAQQTWCVEMLVRGIEPDNLLILTGWDAAQLQPYIQRAKEKTALEQAIQLDHKP